MPHLPRIEAGNLTNFTSTRSCRNQLWFTCDHVLEEAVLGHLAICSERYNVKHYAFAMEGTHKHELVDYPECNRASFQRDFNSAVTRAIKRRYPQKLKGGGPVWRARYSNEFVARNEDIENEFFYTVLQPVQDGLVESIRKYPGYNCFEDAIHGRERAYSVVDWAKYNAEKRWKKNINIADYTTTHILQYARLPGYEELPQEEYVRIMRRKLRERTKQLVNARRKAGKGFLGVEKLQAIIPGSQSKNSKESTRWHFRPRIICGCPKTSAIYLNWYFSILKDYWDASYSYRNVEGCSPSFPPGTYLPPKFTVKYCVTSQDLAA